MPVVDQTRFDWSTVGQQSPSTNSFTSDPNNPGGSFNFNSFGGGTAGTSFDPSDIRNRVSGLARGGGLPTSAGSTIGYGSESGSGAVSKTDDWRVRVSLADENWIFYKDTMNELLRPLSETNGVVFPYVPTINFTHQAIYNNQSLTHSNYAMQFYQSSEVSDISIQGDFTVQNSTEGKYLMAVIYFFRACTKMFFGYDKQLGIPAGNPPPLVYLDGYGEHYFPHVPCVLTSFSHTLPNDVDYLEIPITSTVAQQTVSSGEEGFRETAVTDTSTPQRSGGTTSFVQEAGTTTNFGVDAGTVQTQYVPVTTNTRLPTSSSISITLRPVYSRKSLHEKFNLEDFAAGRLLSGKGSFL